MPWFSKKKETDQIKMTRTYVTLNRGREAFVCSLAKVELIIFRIYMISIKTSWIREMDPVQHSPLNDADDVTYTYAQTGISDMSNPSSKNKTKHVLYERDRRL